MLHSELVIQEFCWCDVCDRVAQVHPALADVINAWNPSSHYKLYHATYHYGDTIFKANTLNLPNGHGTVPITSSEVPASLKDALSYSSFPVGIILSKKAEVYFEHESMLVPFAVFGGGIPIGLLETLYPTVSTPNPAHVWSTNAGIRTLFMLPKVSEKQSHARLQKEFGFMEEAPKKYSEQFSVFHALSKCPYFLREPWQLEVLFFSKEWFKRYDKNKGWLLFYNYLLSYFIQYSAIMHIKPSFDVLWHLFAYELTKRRKRPGSNMINMLKHIIEIIVGITPGYRPATAHDSDYAPIMELQQAYIDIYKVNCFPTIMIPSHFGRDHNDKPLYFSLKYSSGFNVNPKMKESESLITDVFQLYSLYMDFFNFLKSLSNKLIPAIIESPILTTDLTFFYDKPETSNIYRILPSSELVSRNPDFIPKLKNQQLPFADSSSFIRGCIMLSKKVKI